MIDFYFLVYRKREEIDECVIHINDHIESKCSSSEHTMVKGTVGMVEQMMRKACKHMHPHKHSRKLW